MTAKDVIRHSLDMSDGIINMYLADLEDADLRIRPIEGMNPIAWQLGHLVASERSMLEGVKPGSSPALPEGFDARHGREQAGMGDDGLRTKAEYLELWKAQRAATKAALDALPDEKLGAPGPERMHRIAPTVGAVFNMMGMHAIGHANQWVAVRRKLKKPIAF